MTAFDLPPRIDGPASWLGSELAEVKVSSAVSTVPSSVLSERTTMVTSFWGWEVM